MLHLRFPFSFFLLPIYCCGLAIAGTVDWPRAVLVFVILHLLVYPASNGFNSYFDRDLGSIGCLPSPPPVSRSLLVAALALDLAGLAASFLVSPLFALAVLLYGLGSKLYSWPGVRLKRRPFGGWLATGLGQGGATLVAIVIGVDPAGLSGLGPRAAIAALLFTLLFLGIFPLTQVYQHEEDSGRGDITISVRLGIRGTFALSGAFLGMAILGWIAFLAFTSTMAWTLAFALMQAPALAIFAYWAVASFRDPKAANYRNTMRMNVIASLFLNAFFALYLALGQQGGAPWIRFL